ncbi:MAG: DnaJ domain-containing protein [Armatimonadota bacterium]
MSTLYQILGVKPKAAADEVKNAYRKLARAYHPDFNPDPKAHERMAAINSAFEVLSDPVRRMEYDASIGQAVQDEPSQNSRAKRPEAVHATVRHRLRDHRTPVYAMAYVPGTPRMVSTSFDNEVLWWDDGGDTPSHRQKLEGGVVSAFSVQGDRKLVAAGTTEQNVTCWVVNGERIKSWRSSPKDWVCCVMPSPDGQSVAMGSVENSMRVVRSVDGQNRFQGCTHRDSVTALAWAADSSILATGSADATVKLWCGITGRELSTIMQVRSTVTAMAFSPDDKWLAVAAVDLSLRVFNMKDLSLQKIFHGHERPIETLAFHPRGWLLGSGSRDGTVGLWNVRQGIGHGRIEASHQPVSCLAFSPDGVHMAAGGLDKVLRVWHLTAAKASA